MTIAIRVEKDEDQILAVYATIREGQVARTVEIVEGACYADEDANGNLLGVEMLAPGKLNIYVPAVAEHYPDEEVEKALNLALENVRL